MLDGADVQAGALDAGGAEKVERADGETAEKCAVVDCRGRFGDMKVGLRRAEEQWVSGQGGGVVAGLFDVGGEVRVGHPGPNPLLVGDAAAREVEIVVHLGGRGAALDETVDEQSLGVRVKNVVLKEIIRGVVLNLELAGPGLLAVVVVERVVDNGAVRRAAAIRVVAADGDTDDLGVIDDVVAGGDLLVVSPMCSLASSRPMSQWWTRLPSMTMRVPPST